MAGDTSGEDDDQRAGERHCGRPGSVTGSPAVGLRAPHPDSSGTIGAESRCSR